MGQQASRPSQADGAEVEPEAGSGTPLELALAKVEYVDPTFGKGEGKRKFKDTEVAALKSGSDDMSVASCSPFAYWTLAAAGIDINADIEGDGVSIREETGVFTKKAVSLDDYYKAYVGRLSTSVWANHVPADPTKIRNVDKSTGSAE
ncbi:hypothetical protein [Haliangium sp.]|uniref:hypothetical protein n=1 Tax=Haliangium sp. TaxID=2663208 RepID=UPI003D152B44